MIRALIIAAGIILAARPAPAQQASASTLNEETLHAYAVRMLAEQKAKAEPMPLPALDPFPPDPQPVAPPPKPKAEPPPAPPPVMVAMRARGRVEYNLCSRFGMHKVQVDRWRWRCRR